MLSSDWSVEILPLFLMPSHTRTHIHSRLPKLPFLLSTHTGHGGRVGFVFGGADMRMSHKTMRGPDAGNWIAICRAADFRFH